MKESLMLSWVSFKYDNGRYLTLLATLEIEVNESLLTGESDLILKSEKDTLLSGSYVVSGKCYAKIEKVGENNFANRIISSAKKQKSKRSKMWSLFFLILNIVIIVLVVIFMGVVVHYMM